MSESKTWRQWIGQLAKNRQQLELASGALAVQDLQSRMETQRRLENAEERAAVRAAGWGELPETDSEMPGDIHFGDNVRPTSKLLPALAAAGLMATGVGVPLAYLGGKLIDKLDGQKAESTHTENTMGIGLGDIEDVKFGNE